jgi:hypothetical protein
MPVKTTFHVPEIALGALVAISIFAMGMLYSSLPLIERQEATQTHQETKNEATRISAEERIADYTWWLTWLTGILAGSTVGLWGVTYFTLRHGRETAERQLRAYLSIERSIRQDGEIQLPIFGITFKNCGQTPAYAGTFWVDIQIHPMPLKAELIPTDRKMIGTFILPPTNTFSVDQLNDDSVASLTEPQIPEFREGNLAYYVFGRLDFIDAFGKARWLKFRSRYAFNCVAKGGLHMLDIETN